MGLGALFERIARAIDAEYERRIRAASNVTEYGAGHGHAHVSEPAVEVSHDPAQSRAAVGAAVSTPDAAPDPDLIPPVHS